MAKRQNRQSTTNANTATDASADATTALLDEAWSDRPPVARQLAAAAVDAFARQSYHATTTRDIATSLGLSPAAIYVHFRSKEDLLYEIARLGNAHALSVVTASADISDPTKRLRVLVRTYSSFIARHRTMAQVVLHEYKWLNPDHHDEVAALRRRTIAGLRDAIKCGITEGTFAVPDLTAAVIAIMAICVDITNWFPAQGLADPEQVGALYAEYAIRMLTPPGTVPTLVP